MKDDSFNSRYYSATYDIYQSCRAVGGSLLTMWPAVAWLPSCIKPCSTHPYLPQHRFIDGIRTCPLLHQRPSNNHSNNPRWAPSKSFTSLRYEELVVEAVDCLRYPGRPRESEAPYDSVLQPHLVPINVINASLLAAHNAIFHKK